MKINLFQKIIKQISSFIKEVAFHLKQWVIMPSIVILFFVGLYHLYDYFAYARIIARYDDAKHIKTKTGVFYRGYKIGEVYKIEPSKNFSHIMVYLKIDKYYLKLPSNTVAKTKSYKLKDIKIELLYPEEPSKYKIYHKKYIAGKTSKTLEDFFQKQVDSGLLDNVSGDFSGIVDNFNKTSIKIDKIADLVAKIIIENRKEIKRSVKNIGNTTENLDIASRRIKDVFSNKQFKNDIVATTNNLSKTTASLSKMADNLEEGVDKNNLKESIQNIRDSSKNIKDATQNINCATTKLRITMDKTNDTLDSADNAFKNVSKWTKNTTNILSKRFALLQLIFGKPGKKLEETE